MSVLGQLLNDIVVGTAAGAIITGFNYWRARRRAHRRQP